MLVNYSVTVNLLFPYILNLKEKKKDTHTHTHIINSKVIIGLVERIHSFNKYLLYLICIGYCSTLQGYRVNKTDENNI